MAHRSDVLQIVACVIIIFAIKKPSFTCENKVYYLFDNGVLEPDTNETFILSSLWQFRQQNGMNLRFKDALRILLIISGDVELCPGPLTKCNQCNKGIRKNIIKCKSCIQKFHPRCFKSVGSEKVCFICLSNVAEKEPDQHVERNCPELKTLLKSNGLKVLHLNIRGLLNNLPKLEEIFSSFKNIDIFGVTETHLNDDDSVSIVYIPGYTFVNKPRVKGRGGGVGVYISNRIPYHRRFDLENDTVECIWLEITYPKTKSFLIGIIYRPPDTSDYLPPNFNNLLDDVLTLISVEGKELSLLGDINCNYLDKKNNVEVKSIFTLYGLNQLITVATRVTENTSTLIDVILTNEPSRVTMSTVIPCDISDHNIIGYVRKINFQRFPAKLKSHRDYKKYDVNEFRKDVKSINWQHLYSTSNVNLAWKSFKSLLLEKIDKHAPMISKRIQGRNCPWLSEELKRELNKKDQLLRKARASKKEFDWSAYKIQRNRSNTLLRRTKNKYHQSVLNDNLGNPDKFWKTIKEMYPSKSSSNNNVRTSSFNIDGVNTTDNATIANRFNQFFSTVASKLKAKSIVLKDFIWASRTKISVKCPNNFNFRLVSTDEVFNELRKLKKKKATGIDNIPSKLVRDCASEISSPITYIINLSLSSSTVPSDWKMAKIIPIFKSGNSNDVDNYRPISILPVISKIQEKLVHRQLINHLEDNNMLYSNQFGFRSKKSTEQAATYFIDNIRTEMDNGKLTGAVFIDLSKAFDTISHAGLLNKLPEYGIKSTELEWLTDYLFNRKQFVLFDDKISSEQPVYSGVPQGSILGPLLFLIHFNDIATHIKNSRIIKYADDTVIYFSHKDVLVIQNKLSEDCNLISRWLDSNDLIINLKPGKTETMLFGTAKRLCTVKDHNFEVKIKNRIINNTILYKYLGVKLDITLNLGINFNEMYRKASGRLRLLYRLRNSITIHTANCIYRSFIVPLPMYCAITNLNLTKTQLSRLENINRRAEMIIRGQSTAFIINTKIYDLMKIHCCSIVERTLFNQNDFECFKDYFTLMNNCTRNQEVLLRLPKFKLETGKNTFKFMGAKIFNELPLELRRNIGKNGFKSKLKIYFNGAADD